MKRSFTLIACIAGNIVAAALTGYAQPRPPENRSITGSYFDTATIASTFERIKGLQLPAGFQIAKFAEVSNPRMLARGNNGAVYVSQRYPGTLTMLKDTDSDGVADIQRVVAEKKQTHGVFVDGNKIYLATVKEVFVADIQDDGSLSELRMLIDDLPDAGQHPNRTIAVHKGKLYISVGSTCNACDESNVENAAMLVSDLDGKNRRVFASGLRNTIGFGWHPTSGKMFGMDHGIDMLGDNDQEEELNELIDGEKYGWAYVYAKSKLNPHNKVPKDLGLTNEDWAKQSKEPVLLYTPHAAPMQMLFYTSSMFPQEYKNDALVVFRGSWNRNPPSGYEIARVHFSTDGKPQRCSPFLGGFLVKGGGPNGIDAHFARLAGIAKMQDGSILVSDDTNNIVYRITYGNNAVPKIMQRDKITMLLPETANATSSMTVSSKSFSHMGTIPDRHSDYFDGISPAVGWSVIPKEAKSIVVMVEDPDALLKPVTHWIIANISPNITELPEGIIKSDTYVNAIQGANITAKPGYYGPKPPAGDMPHSYHFQVFALDKLLTLPTGFNRQALLDAISGHVLAKGEIVGEYQRKPDERNKK